MVETIVFIWVFAELEYCAVGVVGILTCRRRNLWCGNACVVTFHVLVLVVVELAVMNNNRTVTVAVQFRKLQSSLCLGRSAGITVVVDIGWNDGTVTGIIVIAT